MNIIVTGVNYKNTPLDIREKFSFKEDEQQELLGEIFNTPNVSECVLISTCNRTEVYVYFDCECFDSSSIEKILCDKKQVDIYSMKKHFYTYKGIPSVKHLFEVTSGLDSMVLGEDQILGQVKSAHDLALKNKTSGCVLNILFRDAITASKKIKTETKLSHNSVSIGSIGVKLAEDIFLHDLKNKTALIIGTGKIGIITLKNLISKGVTKIILTNRTHGKLADISKSFGGIETVLYNQRYESMEQADIVVSCTSSPHYTVTKDLLEESIKSRKKRVFIDLAVPRDLDETIDEIEGVHYFNIDDLEGVSCKNSGNRVNEAHKAKQILFSFIEEFEKWYQFRSVMPVVKDVKSYAEGLLNKRIDYALKNLKSASDEEKHLVKESMMGAVRDILGKFVYEVKENNNCEELATYFSCLGNSINKNDVTNKHKN